MIESEPAVARATDAEADGSPAPASGRRRTIVAVAGLGMLVYLGVALVTDGAALARALGQLGVGGTAAVLGLSLVNYALRFLRWDLYLSWLGHRIPTAQHLLIYLGGFAFTVSPAKTGEAVRSVYLRRYGVSYAESVAALFAERLLDLLAMALLAVLIVADRPAYRPLLGGVLVAAVLFVGLVSRPQLGHWLDALAPRVGERPRRVLRAVIALLASSRRLLRARLLLVGLVLGVIAWGGEGIGLWLIAQGMDITVAPVAGVGIYAVAVLAGGAAFFMPGGIGGMEVVMSGLLVAQGASLPAAVVATLLCRLATLWFAVVLGLAAVALIEASAQRAGRTGSNR